MNRYSYGNKQYIAVEGLDKALQLMKALMEARECEVLLQRDDADIYVVSWANHYGDWSGESFIFMDELQLDEWLDYRAEKEMSANSAE